MHSFRFTMPICKTFPVVALALLISFSAHAGDAAVTELRFRDFFQLPVGPRGLQPSPQLLALDGRQVRISGYMAAAETPTAGGFILAPLPVKLGDEDESLADDLPASIVHVRLTPSDLVLAPLPGRIWLTGTLQLGQRQEADGRLSIVHLQLDAAQSAALVRLQTSLSARQP